MLIVTGMRGEGTPSGDATEIRALYSLAQSLCNLNRVVFRPIEQRDAELIAAVATGETTGGRHLAKDVSETLEQHIANDMTEIIVPQFESVSINEEKRDVGTFVGTDLKVRCSMGRCERAASLDLLTQAFAECRSAQQLRELIDFRFALHLIGEARTLQRIAG